jgi:hypothetical protein
MVLAPGPIPSQTHPGCTTVFMLLCPIVRVITTVAASPCFPCWGHRSRFKSPHDRPDMRWNFGTWVTRKALMVSSFYNGAGLNKILWIGTDCGILPATKTTLRIVHDGTNSKGISSEFVPSRAIHMREELVQWYAADAIVSCWSHAKKWNQTFVRYIQTQTNIEVDQRNYKKEEKPCK